MSDMKNKNLLVKPYLKWAGGKRQLLPEIRNYLPKGFSCYYEPFVGAGAVFFDLQPKNAVINDSNAELINTYLVIKENLKELLKLLKEYEVKNNPESFYEIRRQDREKNYSQRTDVERAARFIYLNKTCYNGLYRVNSQGLFNTPFGNYDKPAIVNEPVLKAVNKYLNHKNNNIRIISEDFEKSVEDAMEGDFVYFDPPYHSPDGSNFTGYQSGGFDEKEQRRLFNLYRKLTDERVLCMLSNSSTEFIRKLYSDFPIVVVQANRSINSNPNDRGAVDEILVINWSKK